MEELQKIKRPETLLSLAYDRIKGLLVSGQLDFDQIYSGNQFAEMLGVSRTPVRVALLQLAAEGLLIPVQGRGCKIKGFSEKEIKDFFEARLMIETYVNQPRLEGLDPVYVRVDPPVEDVIARGVVTVLAHHERNHVV